MRKFVFRTLSILIVSSFIFSNSKILAFTYNPNDNTVEVTSTVPPCVVTITVKPEKRIPQVNHWTNSTNFIINNSLAQQVYAFSAIADENGQTTIDLCANNILLKPGVYSFNVKGFSHISKIFDNISTFNYQHTFIDLSANEERLLAGDTNDDNIVNNLDISKTIQYLYSDDIKNDLNRDGQVNSLDITNEISNLNKVGD